MAVTVTSGNFKNRDDAVQLIEQQVKFARDGAMQSGDLEDVHWHKTSLQIYVLTGRFETRDVVTDTLLPAGPGDLITIPQQTLHAARCPEPATYVVGFESEDAAKQFGPQKPEDLPDAH
ncbi:MAG: quercetin dioxygenase-like cupin family protein [Candidatus Azotimanducaceae bacterium]|jgi:quercetin dioxygenase-like cupin family protein